MATEPYKDPLTCSPGETSHSPVQTKPQLLTTSIHEALIALGRAAAVSRNRKSVGLEQLPDFDYALYQACYEGAHHMMSGQEYNMGTSFTVRDRQRDWLRRPSSNLSPGSTRAQEIYMEVIGTKELFVETCSWNYMSSHATDQLARNAQNLEWCNRVWSQLCASGAVQADCVRLFVSIIMTAMRVKFSEGDFPSQWSALGNIRTLDELKVIQLSASIRTKPGWKHKLQNNDLISKWREEVYSQEVTPSMFEFLIAELRWYADNCDPETGIEHATVPGVFVSDALVSPDERTSLRAEVEALSAVPPNRKDWHPRSDDQVLDLVHPSLYPYVRGRTLRFLDMQYTQPVPQRPESPDLLATSGDIDAVAKSILSFLHPPPPKPRFSGAIAALSASGHGVVTSASMPHRDIVEFKWRSKSMYQWLPVDVDVSTGPNHASRFLSYVNNLHPAPVTPSGRLYPVLEDIFSRFIPLFEHTLTDTRLRRNEGVRTAFLSDSNYYWDTPGPYDESISDYDFDDLMEDWIQDRKFVRPVVKPFVPPGPPGEEQVILGGRTLQVIIKMANVHLTPSKPEYAGGSWHVEGTDNERIVATGIYYFESENISDSSLNFRQAIDDPEYEQDKHDHFQYLYGISNSSPEGRQSNQLLGAVATPENRSLCFPNGMQHCLSPFKLADSTKPGHRKVLVFFLVDPSQRILSTSDVPPQQLDWLLEHIRLQAGTRLSRLPPELFDYICGFVRALADQDVTVGDGSSSSWVMTSAEAKEHRLKLMDERAQFVMAVNDEIYEREFSLCEH